MKTNILNKSGFLLLALPLLMLAGCAKDEISAGQSGTAVNFTTGIDSRTTANGAEWLLADQVGIFMVTTGGTLPDNIVVGATSTADNRLYKPATAASSSALAPATADQAIYYPQTGNVDFIAYYPWRETPAAADDPYVYKVSVSDQSNPAAIDLMWAKSTNVSNSVNKVGFAFAHKLSRLTLSVKAGDGIASTDISALATTDIAIIGMPSSANLALATGVLTAGDLGNIQPLKAAAAGVGADATFSATIIPQPANTTGRGVTFAVGGVAYLWNIPNTTAFDAGKSYTYTITIDKTGGVTVSTPAITPWTVGASGSSTGTYPYAVGDYYPDPNVTFSSPGVVKSGTMPIGVVFWLDNPVADRSAHGKIVSLDESDKLSWSTQKISTGATSDTDGLSNMSEVATIADWTTKYPPFNWVHEKNPENTTYASGDKYKWYLPAIEELQALRAAWNGGIGSKEVGVNRTIFSRYLTNAGGTALLVDISDYWSSSQRSSQSAMSVRFSSGTTYNNVSTDNFKVRAISAF